MKLYLAGFETAVRSYQIDHKKIGLDTNLFLSYYYRTSAEQALEILKPGGHRGIITVDSGAHSFFSMMGIGTGAGLKDGEKRPDPHDYFKKLFTWAEKYQELFDYFCELDLQEIVGQEQVTEWRKKANKAGIGKKMITVHHSCNSWKDFEKLCKDSASGYIAIEGLRKGEPMLEYNKYIKFAYDRGIKIHGFAFTRAQLLYSFPFYSVDSSSWTSPPRYGVLNKFDGQGMKSVTAKKIKFLEHNVPIELHSSFKSKAETVRKLEWSAAEYIKIEKYFTKLWRARGINWKD